jgi:hypothetical protein
VWQNRERVTLNSESYALNFHPVVAGDTGEYKCLVNDRRLPESILKLVVQGKNNISLFDFLTPSKLSSEVVRQDYHAKQTCFFRKLLLVLIQADDSQK